MATDPMIEVRADYGVGTVIFMLRWFTQWKRFGWSGMGYGDIFSVMAWVFFTALYVTLEFIVLYGAPVGMTEEMRLALSESQRDNAAIGGMVMFGAFYMLICFLWCLKGSLTFLFLSLTRDTKLHNYVRLVGWSIVVSWVAAMLTHSLHCLPVHKNWQILPHPGKECSMGFSTNIVIAAGNVLSDLMLLVVPVFMLADAHIPLARKFKIGSLLSLGLFVMSFDILRCVLSLGSSADAAAGSAWAQREAIVAIVAVNAPQISPIFTKQFWRSRTSTSASLQPKNSGSLQTIGQQRWRKIKKDTEIYKMTNFETRTASAESESALVHESDLKREQHAHDQHNDPTQPWQSTNIRTRVMSGDSKV